MVPYKHSTNKLKYDFTITHIFHNRLFAMNNVCLDMIEQETPWIVYKLKTSIRNKSEKGFGVLFLDFMMGNCCHLGLDIWQKKDWERERGGTEKVCVPVPSSAECESIISVLRARVPHGENCVRKLQQCGVHNRTPTYTDTHTHTFLSTSHLCWTNCRQRFPHTYLHLEMRSQYIQSVLSFFSFFLNLI